MPDNNNQPAQSHQVIFMPAGRRGRITDGQSVLEAARHVGVEIESICGGHLTCGKCKVKIEDGNFAKHGIVSSAENLSAPSEEETRLLERLHCTDHRLSCAARLHGDLLVTVPEESQAVKQIIRKTATERAIDVVPSVRQVYLKVDKATLGEHRGDWGRVQAALAEQWQLPDVRIDLQALRRLQAALRDGKQAITLTLWQDTEVIDVQPGYAEGVYGLAVDIGSTTIAAYLCDLRTGALLASDSMMNPQVTYGEDLMSRISYAMEHSDGLRKMHKAVIDGLNRLAARTTKQAGLQARDIHELVLVGNTTMTHILLNIDPSELGVVPFALANRDAMDVKARELNLHVHPGANVHVLPAEAGHVGADNVGVLIAETPYRQDKITLIVDIGTNGEIVLGNKNWLYSASSPTGPAFEGAQIAFGMRAAPGAIERVRIDRDTLAPRVRVIGDERWSDEWQTGPDALLEAQPQHLPAGICGSGIIEAVAELFLAGILLPDGRFNPAVQSEFLQWEGRKGSYILVAGDQTATGQPIVVTQSDVRNIQLAKAALYAGAKLLMNEAGVSAVERIVLAGAFGSYIDPKHAMVLGLIPDCDLTDVAAVGNAAGDGARIALLNRAKRDEARRVAREVTYIETAASPDFQEEFVAAMHLPHMQDDYPHLRDILPQPEAAPSQPERKRRRRQVARAAIDK